MTTMPTINAKGTPPIELLEQYELAITAMHSAISTVAAVAPDAGDYRWPSCPHRSLHSRRTNIVIASRGLRA
jgi:hypothetical protein